MYSELFIKEDKCRESITNLLNLIYLLLAPVLGATFTLFILPALACGCSSVPEIEERTVSSRIGIKSAGADSGPSGNAVLDIFVFNDDRLKRLDSYQRFEHWDGARTLEIASCSGEKVLFAIANSGFDRFSWTQVNSLNSLDRIKINLEDETPERPVMSGSIYMQAGGRPPDLILETLTAKVILRSLWCDFSGTPYEGENMHEAKAYLINVNAECTVNSDGEILPSRIINLSGANPEEIDAFGDEGIITHSFSSVIGKDTTGEQAVFLCYPNSGDEDSPGTPFTKLVIEGKIQGCTYYWTIPVNRNGNSPQGNGVYRNCCYIYDINIRHKGSLYPDVDITSEDIDIIFGTEEWDDKGNHTVKF